MPAHHDPPETLTLAQLVTGLQRFDRAARDEAERDVVVPTPQQMSAARKQALLRRARELNIDVDGMSRDALTRAVAAQTPQRDDILAAAPSSEEGA